MDSRQSMGWFERRVNTDGQWAVTRGPIAGGYASVISQGRDLFFVGERDVQELREHLTAMERVFEAHGGRGPDLADEIDLYRSLIAHLEKQERKAKKEKVNA